MAVTAFVDLWNLSNDRNFQARVNVACLSAAGMVMVSAFPLGATANRRRNWAMDALVNPERQGQQAMWAVIATPDVATNGPTGTDANLFQAVSALVPSLVSVYPTALLG